MLLASKQARPKTVFQRTQRAAAARAVWGVCAVLLAPAVVACPLPAPALQQGAVQAIWKLAGEPITVGRHFALEVQVCPSTAVLTRLDAVMPEHRHGMNYRPSVKALGEGRWRVEGLLFHMPGRWELRIDVQVPGQVGQAGQAERLLDTIILP
jgi:hypothetical protein